MLPWLILGVIATTIALGLATAIWDQQRRSPGKRRNR